MSSSVRNTSLLSTARIVLKFEGKVIKIGELVCSYIALASVSFKQSDQSLIHNSKGKLISNSKDLSKYTIRLSIENLKGPF